MRYGCSESAVITGPARAPTRVLRRCTASAPIRRCAAPAIISCNGKHGAQRRIDRIPGRSEQSAHSIDQTRPHDVVTLIPVPSFDGSARDRSESTIDSDTRTHQSVDVVAQQRARIALARCVRVKRRCRSVIEEKAVQIRDFLGRIIAIAHQSGRTRQHGRVFLSACTQNSGLGSPADCKHV